VAEETKPVIQVRKVKTVAVAAMAPAPQENTSQAETTSQTVAAYAEPAPAPAPAVDPVKTSSLPSGWVVQVASSPTQSGAQALLDRTSKQAPKVLADAEGFTVAFDNGGVTYYRARFGGFGSKDAAWKACDALKRKKISCYAVQQ
ncbi:SPOR domain-containing protein, partial [Mesorhizobium sp.]|uniref:SPOR domain-containing protein n=1 Tax=Mesorhizobium sp. TaxID=1871066 RepID=UPI0025C47509